MLARVAALALAALVLSPAALAAPGVPDVAAAQVLLRDRSLYAGTVDGVLGDGTSDAIRTFQRRHRLETTGSLGPRTRAALGAVPLGTRELKPGSTGWDVAALQFALAWHGFPSGDFGDTFTDRMERSLLRFQHWAGLPETGVAASMTAAALARPPASCPRKLAWPVHAPVGDPFGPRGWRFHAGVDLIAGFGAPVTAAAPGRVAWAGPLAGGWGDLVVVAHSGGLRTFYAHLSRIDVHVGQRVATGHQLGLVGATGDATGPHLHFEVRLRGAAVDPLPALG